MHWKNGSFTIIYLVITNFLEKKVLLYAYEYNLLLYVIWLLYVVFLMGICHEFFMKKILLYVYNLLMCTLWYLYVMNEFKKSMQYWLSIWSNFEVCIFANFYDVWYSRTLQSIMALLWAANWNGIFPKRTSKEAIMVFVMNSDVKCKNVLVLHFWD